LIPKQTAAHGLKNEQIQFTDEGLRTIINLYTQEAGLRNLEREIAAACRKVAKQVALGEKKTRKIHTDNLDQFLGRPKIFQEELLKRDQVGVATGLAWTPVGGDVLFVEATAMRGRGGLTLTGQLGDVMKESAQAALSYRVRTRKSLESATTSSRSTTFTSTCPKAQSLKMVRRPVSRWQRRSCRC